MLDLSVVQRLVDETAREHGIPGVSVAVSLDRGPAAPVVSGVADLATDELLSPAAVFPIYSITKTFMAVATVSLAQQGRLDLDAPLSRWLDDPRVASLTLRQVLNHSAGIPDYGRFRSYHAAVQATPGEPWPLDRLFDTAFASGLDFPPGQEFRYSNTGYTFLKRLLEAATGRSYAQVLADEIFRPLGLRSARVVETPADLAALTPGYSHLFQPSEGLQDMRGVYHPGWVYTGLVAATAEDVARFLDGVFGGALLDPAGLAALCDLLPVPQFAGDPYPFGYGLGLMGKRASPYGPFYGHEGGGPGYGAAAYHAPAVHGHALTVAVLINRDPSEQAGRLAFGLLDWFATRLT